MVAGLIQFKGIGKAFPGVQALAEIDLDIAAGSCHALIGENGAGKSTLGKILAGIYTPDEGTLWVNGRETSFRTVRDAVQAGIGMVHQELLFCENMTVSENLCLGQLPGWGPFLSRRRMVARAREWLAALEADIDPDEIIGDLTISRQQLVQIASAVGRGAHILVFDEPTSSLSQRETERLFGLIDRLKEQGVTMVYISHRLEEIFRVADTVSVLRDGRLVATRSTQDCDEDGLVEMMIGRPLNAYFPSHLGTDRGEPLLRVDNLCSPGRFEGVSFTLHGGEILGLAGLVGAGRSEVAAALFGLDPTASGRIEIRGRPVRLRTARQAMQHGLGLVPEDRKRHGLVLSMNARENISLPIMDRLSTLGWIHRRKENALAAKYFERLSIRAPSLDTASEALSGGNQQKLVIARWIAAECGILLVDEPTRGVDVGAKAEIHGLIDRLAGSGAGVLLISSELPEVINLSTRILVLRDGRIVGELPREEATQDGLMRLMAGLSDTT